jgi:hypothetical protein
MSCHHDPERNAIVNNCASCHETTSAIYSGAYLDIDLPDFMFDAGVVCEDCHLVDSAVARPQPSICADCHDEEYPEMLLEWRTELSDLAAEVRTLMDQIPSDMRDTETYRRAGRVLGDLGPNAVAGVHNSELARELLSDIRSELGSTARADED